jgi:hypothetical protein
MPLCVVPLVIQGGTRPTGAVVEVSCSNNGLMCVAQSCCVINVFRGACFTFNVSVVGLLTQGVDTASINQLLKQ